MWHQQQLNTATTWLPQAVAGGASVVEPALNCAFGHITQTHFAGVLHGGNYNTYWKWTHTHIYKWLRIRGIFYIHIYTYIFYVPTYIFILKYFLHFAFVLLLPLPICLWFQLPHIYTHTYINAYSHSHIHKRTLAQTLIGGSIHYSTWMHFSLSFHLFVPPALDCK